jgi:hypothetical protein
VSTLLVTTGVNVSRATAVLPSSTQQLLVILPVLSATHTAVLGPKGEGTIALAVSMAPTVDMFTGHLSNRVQATWSLLQPLPMFPSILLAASAGVVQSLPVWTSSVYSDPNVLTGLTGGLELRWHVNRQLDVSAGEQDFWQAQIGYGMLASEIGYISVTVRTPAQRL